MLNEIRNNEFLDLFEKVFKTDLGQHLYAESCIFLRVDSKCWEKGLLINSGEKLTDFNGQEVEIVEDIKTTPDFLVDVDNMQFDY